MTLINSFNINLSIRKEREEYHQDREIDESYFQHEGERLRGHVCVSPNSNLVRTVERERQRQRQKEREHLEH